MKKCFFLSVLLLVFAATGAKAAEGPEYVGWRTCSKCHDQQGASWRESGHAKAFESLKPNVKEEAKRNAGLDPAKDYTQDKNCVGCHVTGFGHASGYRIGMDANEARVLVGVGCESCHGAGGDYRREHAAAADKLKTTGESTDRNVLVEAKQNFDYEKACARCHLNYEGSQWAETTLPLSPFTPTVDPKYHFDFDKAVRDTGEKKAVHTHYRLRGVFTGGSVPAIRAEIQKTAKEPEE